MNGLLEEYVFQRYVAENPICFWINCEVDMLHKAADQLLRHFAAPQR